MMALLKARVKAEAKARAKDPNWKPEEERSIEPLMDIAARFALLFDGIKLIGSGNGAGALASLAAMNYLASRPELQFSIKIAAIAYCVGLLIFAVPLSATLSAQWFFPSLQTGLARSRTTRQFQACPKSRNRRAYDAPTVIGRAPGGVGMFFRRNSNGPIFAV
jgi:hypothetical protein